MSKKLLLLIMLTMLPVLQIFAQNMKISGTVTDEYGEGLPGVFVQVVGSNVGTTTDANGKYNINAEKGATLKFSCIGQLDSEVVIGNSAIVDIGMKPDALMLNEAVAVGYGTIIKKDLSSSVASVGGDKVVERVGAVNLAQAIAGKVAGVESLTFTGKPDGSSTLRIRGLGSVNASSDPVYVVDGVVDVDPNLINPNDIESVDVLKDAAATAIYGSKGANGVVIVTTKAGKVGKGTITYDGRYGVGKIYRTLDLCNAEEFMEIQRRAYAYSGQTMPHLTTPMENLFDYQKDASGNYVYDSDGLLIATPKYDTDWMDVMTQDATTTSHTLSFAQGNDKSQVYSSLSYQGIEGIIVDTGSKRYTGSINFRSKINDYLDIQAVASGGSFTTYGSEGTSSLYQMPLRNALEMPPIVPVKYEDGSWGRKNDYPFGENGENPLRQIQGIYIGGTTTYGRMSLSTDFHILPELTLTIKGDADINHYKSKYYEKEVGILEYSDLEVNADLAYTDTQKWSNEDYLTYNHTFLNGALRSNFVLGTSWYSTYIEGASLYAEGFDPAYEYHNLGAGDKASSDVGSSMSKNTMNSYYFRTNQVLKDKYIFGFTIRADGASNFGSKNKFGYFPSASAAWIVSQEPFFESAKNVVSNLKLRASYGAVGNASIPNYQTISQYTTANQVFNNSLETSVLLGNLANESLKWETTTQLDLGVDLALFNNRIEIVADYYNKITSNMLFSQQIPYTTGFSTSWANVGKIGNRGFELTIHSHNIDNRNFRWDTDFIYSTNKIKAIDLVGNVLQMGPTSRSEEGHIWGEYYIYHLIGTWGTDEADEAALYGCKPGDHKYEDMNGDYVIDDNDRYYSGKSGYPKGEISLVNSISWKGFTFMLDLNSQFGFWVYNQTRTMLEQRQLYANGVKTLLTDAWTPEHQNTKIAAIRLPSDNNFGEGLANDYNIEKGDFLRIRNIMISYDASSLIKRYTKFIQGLNVGVNVENAYIFTGYRGFDPENAAWYTMWRGWDMYSYPRPRTISGNIKIIF